ncbi:hypothetical protein [Aeromicrobium sp. P5_D10]
MLRIVAPAGVSLLLAAAFVLLMAWTSSVTVNTAPGPGGYQISTGWPMVWVTQTSSATPPLPGEIHFGSPWENPTDIDALALALNILVRWIAVMVLVFALFGLRKRPDSTEPDREGDHRPGSVVPRGAAHDLTGGSAVRSTL